MYACNNDEYELEVDNYEILCFAIYIYTKKKNVEKGHPLKLHCLDLARKNVD